MRNESKNIEHWFHSYFQYEYIDLKVTDKNKSINSHKKHHYIQFITFINISSAEAVDHSREHSWSGLLVDIADDDDSGCWPRVAEPSLAARRRWHLKVSWNLKNMDFTTKTSSLSKNLVTSLLIFRQKPLYRETFPYWKIGVYCREVQVALVPLNTHAFGHTLWRIAQ